jgi:hypothetical protein
MAGGRSRRGQGAGGASGTAQYVKLEQRLVLLAWLNGHFGYEHSRDLLSDMKEAGEGFDAAGRSYVYHRLEARGDKVQIPPADLARYDDNIREHDRAPADLHALCVPVRRRSRPAADAPAVTRRPRSPN